MLKDWECYTDLLLLEPENPRDALNDAQETSLIELMVCAVKQSATGELPANRCSKRRQLPVEELERLRGDRTKLTRHFCQTLPSILSKYQANVDIVAKLLELPLCFDLDFLSTPDQDPSLDQLLGSIDLLVGRKLQDSVLMACAKIYEALCNNNQRIQSKCRSSRKRLIDGLRDK